MSQNLRASYRPRIDWKDWKTGATGTWEDPHETLDDYGYGPETYIWEDGNFACDCNRAIFFLREPYSPETTPCGDSRFQIVRMVALLPNGDVLPWEYSEPEPAAPNTTP